MRMRFFRMISILICLLVLCGCHHDMNDSAQAGVLQEVSAKQPEEIVMVTIDSSTFLLEKAIEDFNTSQDDFFVKLVKYEYEGLDDMEDLRTRLYASLLHEDSPDLLDLRQLDEVALSKNGYLEDLTPWLENSAVLSKNDYETQVLECGNVCGIQAFLPKTIGLRFMVMSPNVYNGNGWTYEDLLRVWKEHPNANELTMGSCIDTFLSSNLSYFINFDKAECDFNSEEFQKLLSWILERPGRVDNGSRSEDEIREDIQNGKILWRSKRVLSIRDIQFIEEEFGGETNYVGYPSPDGEPLFWLETMNNIGIMKHSAHKEGAWKFLEFYQKHRDEQQSFIYELPGDRALREQLFQEELAQTSETIGAGEEGARLYRGRYSTERETQIFNELLSKARKLPDCNDDIWEIFCQELPACLSGEKNVEDVTGILQSRIGLYLKENR